MPSNLKIRDRKDPERGEVIAVPLGEERWAYLCSTGGVTFYPYNFVSDKLLRDSPEFARGNWLRPIGWDGNMPATYVTAGRIALLSGEPLAGMWSRLTAPCVIYGAPAGAYIYRDTRGWREITPEEACTLPEEIWLDQDTIVPYIGGIRDSLRFLKGTDDAPPVSEADLEPGSVDLQIMVYTDYCDYDPEQLQDEIVEILEDEEPGCWELIDGSDGQIIIRVEIESASQVTALMRKVLRKKLTPQQLEFVEFERVEDGKEAKTLSILPKPKTRGKS